MQVASRETEAGSPAPARLPEENCRVAADIGGRAAICGAIAVGGFVLAVLAIIPLPPVARQMLQHVALMNVAAPACAVALSHVATEHPAYLRRAPLWLLTVAQILLLWIAHLPAIHAAAMIAAPHVILHASLFIIALLFWSDIVSRRDSGWSSVLALLATAKFACLLGALLIFAPRLVYPAADGTDPPGALADQQLAGLIMIAACPLSYVLSGVVLAALVIRRLASAPARSG